MFYSYSAHDDVDFESTPLILLSLNSTLKVLPNIFSELLKWK